ncbi:hypothetical protein VB620_10060 [Nodularia harveyana UHCC-0300]|uniref:Apea-like HEPN domain-containing protein n=1 Tax=Nodularia harveyana UHCC-0300 TaxID=2974287 RepID=A0ABU5UE85_9CYAN|nr:hypothetical protein [Nodularia harveyana]MEA5581683.1 hypothetical protein [Nodularia harveyana UHCC-0300]
MQKKEAIESSILISKRWLQKSKSEEYQNKNIVTVFDKFFTLFVSYNALYCAINLHDHYVDYVKENKDDKKSVTENVPKYLGYSSLTENLLFNEKIKQGIKQIVRVIEEKKFYIVHSRKDFKPDFNQDTAHINNIKQGLDKNYDELDQSISTEFIKSLLTLIYETRCNMFHGRKQINDPQIKLLIPMNAILMEIIEMGLSKLESDISDIR